MYAEKLRCTNKTIKSVLCHGIERMELNNCDAFDYKVGEIDGSDVIVSLRSKNAVSNILKLEGGYTLIIQVD